MITIAIIKSISKGMNEDVFLYYDKNEYKIKPINNRKVCKKIHADFLLEKMFRFIQYHDFKKQASLDPTRETLCLGSYEGNGKYQMTVDIINKELFSELCIRELI